ncbi:D-alanyl-D-alanine carboxypeptidase / D-alanyl-D-alanine-endopeptidase (penicillin-binding protein 4) [Nitrosomonas cryotolerans]|uniref:D-alanyl-D-alanine carboxypeptidase / D-alanyl-D-alanine-endopeptidase (Penicillin-binding protein 4) n=1 Tax=Nitrosomonas cryotolerans ATCC 49181 TaxID=1131553 RepID=A0A1N6HC90_9PROT|nr:D-alanyl-D-alanine carboxypeptidase/D-alanyl-D-alanine-endopeptidase [Nitrosomonas cryotolerans]SFP73822.1 D-alanyl-D-alanine carboxypeptidase / D-alanyl-D-alanine-endopeptidase (penicillin-binding protein 4) [Nitrosomonas cryotolerans]SIO17373.1 D-alanyl-D-alanine carboxypeptidase / D-alanyl-D-alanine-endopeptidase (penicillin-binding protein 4) [Nitrosomonas cryotolerans ATCC 49181]
MFQLKSTVTSFLILIVVSTPIFSHGLPAPVQQKLKQAGIPESAVGIYVSEVGVNQPLIAVNADTAMNPASVMKLVTTFAGLELLGPAYTWQTELYADGELKDGVLQGNLVIKGYGDPKLDLENFWSLVYRLRQTGLREIRGDLILDYTHYDLPKEDPGAFDGQPYRTYNLLPEALLVNYRTSALYFTPQPDNNTVGIVVDPLPESLQLNNNLKLTYGQCGDWLSLLNADIHVDEGEDKRISIRLSGSYAVDCGKKTYLLGLHDSASYTRDLFKQLWMQQGGLFQGNVLIGKTPNNILRLKTYRSPPLAEIIRGINKFSNNIAARQLYLTLGTVPAKANDGSPVTLARSGRAIRQWFSSSGLDFPELVIENGSGLSRKERISAHHMGKLLLAAFQSPVMPEFIASLPIVAIDGTMKNRLIGTPVSGMAHMKTGALNGVQALAGYMLDKFKRRVIVVFFVNHPNASQARPALDLLLQWVYAR